MLSQQSVVMHKAVDLQERYSKRRDARDAYTRRVVAIGDENTRLHFAREDGITIGKQEGITIGKQVGKLEGVAIIIRSLSQTGNTPEQISSSTRIPLADVYKILKSS